MASRVQIDADYILERVTITNNGCWEWMLSCDRYGYGLVSKTTTGFGLAHRLSYSIFVCDPGESILRHSCDNPPCCNPSHLIPGTQTENLNDMRNKGRGYTKPRSVRTPELVSQVEELIKAGAKQRDIAVLYNLRESMITLIKQDMLRKQNHAV